MQCYHFSRRGIILVRFSLSPEMSYWFYFSGFQLHYRREFLQQRESVVFPHDSWLQFKFSTLPLVYSGGILLLAVHNFNPIMDHSIFLSSIGYSLHTHTHYIQLRTWSLSVSSRLVERCPLCRISKLSPAVFLYFFFFIYTIQGAGIFIYLSWSRLQQKSLMWVHQ